MKIPFFRKPAMAAKITPFHELPSQNKTKNFYTIDHIDMMIAQYRRMIESGSFQTDPNSELSFQELLIHRIRCDVQPPEPKIEDTVDGIWDNPYVLELGIIDHCHEIIQLKDGVRVSKAYKNIDPTQAMATETEKTQHNEMMDLYILLKKWAKNKRILYTARMLRFKEKKVENEKVSK